VELQILLQAEGCNNEFGHESEEAERMSQSERQLKRMGLGLRSIGESRVVLEGETLMRCHFKIHGRVMATVVGRHIEGLKKQVSLATLVALRKDPDLLQEICSCPKKRGAR